MVAVQREASPASMRPPYALISVGRLPKAILLDFLVIADIINVTEMNGEIGPFALRFGIAHQVRDSLGFLRASAPIARDGDGGFVPGHRAYRVNSTLAAALVI